MKGRTLYLQEADICRDGGSIAVDFTMGDGALFSLLLEVSDAVSATHPYKHLHVGSEIQNTCNPLTLVVKGSEDDAKVLALLDAWLETVSPTERTRHRNGELRSSHNPLDRRLFWAIELYENFHNRDV